MYLISEVLGWCTDPDLRDGQTGGAREDACVHSPSSCELCVQLDSNNSAASDKFPSAFDCNVAQSTMRIP